MSIGSGAEGDGDGDRRVAALNLGRDGLIGGDEGLERPDGTPIIPDLGLEEAAVCLPDTIFPTAVIALVAGALRHRRGRPDDLGSQEGRGERREHTDSERAHSRLWPFYAA